jgi:predicted transcriptional regulator
MLFNIIVHYSIGDSYMRYRTKTEIMYRAFLSFRQMKKHLMVLTQNGLLNYDVDTQTFKTTEKGLRFLDTCNKIDGMTKTLAS